MISDSESATLGECLSDFRERFNQNSRVKKLIAGWNREIVVEPLDAPRVYTLAIENLEMTRVSPGTAEREPNVHLQAREEVLKRIFSGEDNPTTAVAEGRLAVLSDAGDTGRLESIAMVIWGL